MKKKCFKLNAEIASTTGEGWFGPTIGPDSLDEFLKELSPGEKAIIEINSPGGDVISGLAMANSIKNSTAHLQAHIVGIAASMASVIACACDEILFEESAFIMIHDPWTMMTGNAEDLRKQADILDEMKQSIKSFYQGKFPADADVDALMSEETWWNGRTALEKGFACELVAYDVRMAACATKLHFAKCPEAAMRFLSMIEDTGDQEHADGSATPQQSLGDHMSELETTVPTATTEEVATEKPAEEAHEAPEAAQTSVEDSIKNEVEAQVLARISAAMKSRDGEINALKKQLAEAENAHAQAVKDAMLNCENEFKCKLEAKDQELAKANAEVIRLTECFDRVTTEFRESQAKAKDLADQLEVANKAKALLTGGGRFTPKSEGSSYASRMAAAKTPEEREELRKLKAQGKI